MASSFSGENKEQLRARKGHDMKWSCDKHGEPIKFFCKDHNVAICHPCATKDHVKSHCELEDIEDVIFEMREKVENTQAGIEETKTNFKILDTTRASSANRLQSVKKKVHDTYEGKLQRVKDKEREDLRFINEEADEKIRIINENRERSLKACKEEAEEQQRTIKEYEAKLISDIRKINEKVEKKLSELQSKNQHDIDILDNMGSQIERIKHDDKTLVNEVPQVIASLNESLSANVHKEVADYLDRIEHEVQRVNFVEGEVGGEHYERIDGYIGEWKFVKSIDIPSIVKKPWVRGLISDDEICVFDYSDKALYVTNISTKDTQKVIQEDKKKSAKKSSAPADSNVMVCGEGKIMWRGDSLDRCITLYDRQWKVVRDISIPRTTSSYNKVYVDVDMEGMILAARYDQSNIYVINPDDGKIVNTITMQGKKVWGRIQALSSGDIIVSTCNPEFTVISRSGKEKTAIHCDEWTSSCCSFDKLTDTLYVTYWDKELNVYAVDEVSCNGIIQARRVVKYAGSATSSSLFSPCLVAPSGKLVAFNGEKLFVYEKSFIL